MTARRVAAIGAVVLLGLVIWFALVPFTGPFPAQDGDAVNCGPALFASDSPSPRDPEAVVEHLADQEPAGCPGAASVRLQRALILGIVAAIVGVSALWSRPLGEVLRARRSANVSDSV